MALLSRRRQGEGRIAIQISGVKDTHRIVNLCSKTGILEFKLVDEDHSLEAALKTKPPPGTEIGYQVVTEMESGRVKKLPFLLRKKSWRADAYVIDAKVLIDPKFDEPYVMLSFNSKGSHLFEQITEAHVNKRIAILLDNRILSAPVIQHKISGGKVRLMADFTMEEATDLAIILRTGPLPAPVTILKIEEKPVSPGQTIKYASIKKHRKHNNNSYKNIWVLMFIGDFHDKDRKIDLDTMRAFEGNVRDFSVLMIEKLNVPRKNIHLESNLIQGIGWM